MQLYIALWWDADDRMYRCAGVYRADKDAWARVRELGGTVQAVTLDEPIRFTHEEPSQHSAKKPIET